MDNIVVTSSSKSDIHTLRVGAEKKPKSSFSTILTKVTEQPVSQGTTASVQEQKILVGSITVDVSTISELLLENQNIGESTWNIIYSDKNKSKDYTKIRPGTDVYFDQKSGALSWDGDGSKILTNNIDSIPALASAPLENQSANLEIAPEKDELVSLGKIDTNNPTVSHLLKNNEDLKHHMWDLLNSDVNKNKPYQRIPADTEIMLNPRTNEIVWENSGVPAGGHNSKMLIGDSVHHGRQAKEIDTRLATNLSDAVQAYKGISYEKINCYELLVKGLNKMNIAYSGKNGLYSRLTTMAAEQGLAENAYLNGEGIVKAAGSTLVTKNYSKITDWRARATDLIAEIEPLLGSGQILSFSTERRGHTGIVGRKGNQWTFINSGRMDNSVDGSTIHRGVGEEVLDEEIGNWFRSAQEKGEALSVTLGQLDQHKIQTASTMSSSFTGAI